MFNAQEKNVITMSLMYFKNDYTPEDAEELGFASQPELETITQKLIDDFVGPTWDEETTATNVAKIQSRMKRS